MRKIVIFYIICAVFTAGFTIKPVSEYCKRNNTNVATCTGPLVTMSSMLWPILFISVF